MDYYSFTDSGGFTSELVTRWTRHRRAKTRQWTRHVWQVHWHPSGGTEGWVALVDRPIADTYGKVRIIVGYSQQVVVGWSSSLCISRLTLKSSDFCDDVTPRSASPDVDSPQPEVPRMSATRNEVKRGLELETGWTPYLGRVAAGSLWIWVERCGLLWRRIDWHRSRFAGREHCNTSSEQVPCRKHKFSK